MNESKKKIYTEGEINALYGWETKLVPSVFYQVFGLDKVWFWDDEGQNYVFDPGTKTVEDEEVENAKSTITVTPEVSNYEFNKYGFLEPDSKVDVELTLSEDLLALYPYPIIKVDGKEYDKGHTSFSLTMSLDHRVSIEWVHNSVVETFRLVARR